MYYSEVIHTLQYKHAHLQKLIVITKETLKPNLRRHLASGVNADQSMRSGSLVGATEEARYVELGNLELPASSNSKLLLKHSGRF